MINPDVLVSGQGKRGNAVIKKTMFSTRISCISLREVSW